MDGIQRKIKALMDNNPNPRIDISGSKFGLLTVTCQAPNRNKRVMWNCKCECGSLRVVESYNLRHGLTKSCGCLQKKITVERNIEMTKHGHAAGLFDGKRKVSRTYRTWRSMQDRCLNENFHNFKDYGGRGIGICDQWLGADGFTKFLQDMGERPEGKTLDRWPDNNGNYEPGNCRWATPKEQAQNRRKAVKKFV